MGRSRPRYTTISTCHTTTSTRPKRRGWEEGREKTEEVLGRAARALLLLYLSTLELGSYRSLEHTSCRAGLVIYSAARATLRTMSTTWTFMATVTRMGKEWTTRTCKDAGSNEKEVTAANPKEKVGNVSVKMKNHPSNDPGEDPDEDGRVGDPRQVRNKIYLTIQTAAASPSNFDISLSTEDKDVVYARPLSCFTTSFINLGFRVLQTRENAGTCCLGRYILPQTWLSPLFHQTYGYTAEIQTVLRRLCCFLWIRIEDLNAVATFTI